MTGYAELTPGEAWEQRERFRIVDVRQEHEFHGPLGHISNATLLPLGQLGERAASLPTDGSLLLVCRSGGRSGIACQKLVELGSAPVTNLTGGMIGWNQADLPIERTAPSTAVALLEHITAYFAQFGGPPFAEARQTLAGLLESAGSTPASPSSPALAAVLDGASALFADGDAPADLELALSAFRADLAAF